MILDERTQSSIPALWLNSPETKTTMSQYSGGGVGVNTKVKELKNRAKRVHVLFELWHKVIESL